jgi:hypothetical protein
MLSILLFLLSPLEASCNNALSQNAPYRVDVLKHNQASSAIVLSSGTALERLGVSKKMLCCYQR